MARHVVQGLVEMRSSPPIGCSLPAQWFLHPKWSTDAQWGSGGRWWGRQGCGGCTGLKHDWRGLGMAGAMVRVLAQVGVPDAARPNKRKHWSLEQRQVNCRAMQRDSGSCPKNILSSWKGFGKALLKARLECGGGRLQGHVISLCTIIWLVDGEGTGWCHRGSCYWSLGSRRPGAMCSWSSNISRVVNICLVVGFHTCKATQELYIK